MAHACIEHINCYRCKSVCVFDEKKSNIYGMVVSVSSGKRVG